MFAYLHQIKTFILVAFRKAFYILYHLNTIDIHSFTQLRSNIYQLTNNKRRNFPHIIRCTCLCPLVIDFTALKCVNEPCTMPNFADSTVEVFRVSELPSVNTWLCLSPETKDRNGDLILECGSVYLACGHCCLNGIPFAKEIVRDL